MLLVIYLPRWLEVEAVSGKIAFIQIFDPELRHVVTWRWYTIVCLAHFGDVFQAWLNSRVLLFEPSPITEALAKSKTWPVVRQWRVRREFSACRLTTLQTPPRSYTLIVIIIRTLSPISSFYTPNHSLCTRNFLFTSSDKMTGFRMENLWKLNLSPTQPRLPAFLILVTRGANLCYYSLIYLVIQTGTPFRLTCLFSLSMQRHSYCRRQLPDENIQYTWDHGPEPRCFSTVVEKGLFIINAIRQLNQPVDSKVNNVEARLRKHANCYKVVSMNKRRAKEGGIDKLMDL